MVVKVKIYIIFADFALYGRRTTFDFKDLGMLIPPLNGSLTVKYPLFDDFPAQ